MLVDQAQIERLVLAGRLEHVPANPAHAVRLVKQARAHCRGAETVLGVDPAGAYALVYEGARKGLTAVLLAHGLRPTTIGGHRVLVDVLREASVGELSELAGSFDRMRRRRNDVAYPRAEMDDLRATDVRDALPIAQEILFACAAELGLDHDRDT